MSYSHCITLQDVHQSFIQLEQRVNLFQDVNLTIEQGCSYAIIGPSGVGKSSLLMLLAGLEEPTRGKSIYMHNTAHRPLSELRSQIGFIFQQFHLLPELTALHNVALPLKLRGEKEAERKAKNWLERVGLGHRLQHKPQQMSGGEQQRTAIARALIFEPKFIFADEPTGNLDTQSAADVADILFDCCHEYGAGLVIVTHSDKLASRAERVFSINDGKVVLSSAPLPEVKYA